MSTEPVEVRLVQVQYPKSQKQYICLQCGNSIPRGTKYCRVDLGGQGCITQEIMHLECATKFLGGTNA